MATIKKTIGEGFARGEIYAALHYDPSDKFGGIEIGPIKLAADTDINLTASKVMVNFAAGDAPNATVGTTAPAGWINVNVAGVKEYIPYWNES